MFDKENSGTDQRISFDVRVKSPNSPEDDDDASAASSSSDGTNSYKIESNQRPFISSRRKPMKIMKRLGKVSTPLSSRSASSPYSIQSIFAKERPSKAKLARENLTDEDLQDMYTEIKSLQQELRYYEQLSGKQSVFDSEVRQALPCTCVLSVACTYNIVVCNLNITYRICI